MEREMIKLEDLVIRELTIYEVALLSGLPQRRILRDLRSGILVSLSLQDIGEWLRNKEKANTISKWRKVYREEVRVGVWTKIHEWLQKKFKVNTSFERKRTGRGKWQGR